MLKQDYKEGEMTLSSALALAVKVLNKTMDVSKLSAEKGRLRSTFYFIFLFNVIIFSVVMMIMMHDFHFNADNAVSR